MTSEYHDVNMAQDGMGLGGCKGMDAQRETAGWTQTVRNEEALASFTRWKLERQAAAQKRLAVASNLAMVEAEVARLREEVKQLEGLRSEIIRRQSQA